MSKELANDVALWILLPSMVIFFTAVATTALGTRRSVRIRRQERQIVELEQAADQTRLQASVLEIDWLDYREIPKPEIIALLGKYGWAYRDEELGDKAWLLRFDLNATRNQSGAGQG